MQAVDLSKSKPSSRIDYCNWIAVANWEPLTYWVRLMHRPLPRAALLSLWLGVAAVLLMAVTAIVVMAASPRLHEAAHHHDREGHEGEGCVVTLFATGSAVDQV